MVAPKETSEAGAAEDIPFAGERSESAVPVISRAPRLNVRY